MSEERTIAKYLDSKNDLMLKKVFGVHKHLCISLLNSLLKFEGDSQIEWIEYDTLELIPEIPALEYTIVVVRCKDKRGRDFIVGIQMNWVKDFEQRILFNDNKAYVKQIKKGTEIILAQPIYSLNLVNYIFEKDDEMKDVYYHHYKIVNIENSEKQIKGLEFVFIELPKFKSSSKEEQDYFDLWLRFLTEINEATKEIPQVLLERKELSDAIRCVEEVSLTENELKLYDKVQDTIWAKKLLMDGKFAEGKLIGEARGIAIGEKQKAINIAKVLKSKGIDVSIISESTGLSEEEIQCL